MVGILFIVLFTLILSYFSGKLLSHLFKLDTIVPHIGLGFFSFLGLIQVISYPLVFFHVPTKYILVTYILVSLIIIFLNIYFKINIKATKSDLVAFLLAVPLLVFILYKVQDYTLNEAYLDSVFYLSMVNENSVNTFYGGMNYYRGASESLNYFYDYSSFYTYFSMMIKLVNNLRISDTFTSPIYFYSSLIIFIFVFVSSLYSLSKTFIKDYIFKIFFYILSFYLFFKYYSFALAFIGNSWRISSLSLIYLFIYKYIETENRSFIYISGLLFSSLIGVSSSGSFMALFAYCSLLIYFVFFNKPKMFIETLFSFIFILIFLLIIVIDMSYIFGILFIGFIIAYFIFAYTLYKNPLFFKAHKVLIVASVLIALLISFILQKNSPYPYSFFFNDHSAYDMVHDYFSISHKNIFYPTLLLWLIFILYLLNKNTQKAFKNYLFILVLVFINPLIMTFIITYLTNFVYYRSFELIFNPASIAVFIGTIPIKNFFLPIVGSLILAPLSFNQVNNHFSKGFIPNDDYNSYYRITNSELDTFTFFKNEVDNLDYKPLVVSQIASTKAYINKIELAFSVFETRTADQYADIKKEAPNALINTFFLRDYADQEIYKEQPDYSKASSLLVENDINYLIMKKDQATLVDGEYIPLYLNMRDVAEIIYENDTYVVMKILY